MSQGSGIGGKADYVKEGCGGTVKEGESDEVGAKDKWD